MMIAQGPNMWWNFKKSRIWTIPNRKDQARNWFLRKGVRNRLVSQFICTLCTIKYLYSLAVEQKVWGGFQQPLLQMIRWLVWINGDWKWDKITGSLTHLSIPTPVLSPVSVSSVNNSPENQTEKDKDTNYILD